MGPEALEISREDSKARMKPFRGEIKGVLARGDFVAGIGNAYADEILWHVRLQPYRKRTSVAAEEVDLLHDGMRSCLLEAIEKVREQMGEDALTLTRMRAGAAAARESPWHPACSRREK